MNKLIRTLVSLSLCAILIFSGCSNGSMAETEPVSQIMVEESMGSDHIEPEVFSQTVIEDELMSIDDIEIIALVTMAEAEDECEQGKRLVIDTILNRMDSEEFPNTVYDVIYQPYQFPSMTNGRAERCEVREDICQLVLAELETRTNYDCIFFSDDSYSDYGTPMFQVENHYFSSYD